MKPIEHIKNCGLLAVLLLLPTGAFAQESSTTASAFEACSPESEQHNIALVRAFIEEGQSGRNLDIVGQYLSPDFVDHSGGSNPNHDPSREGSLAFHEALFAAFPDFHVVIHRQIADCDTVVTHKTFHGTQRGDFFGFPATNQPVAIDVIDILRIEDDQVVEHWVVNNMIGRLIAGRSQ